VKAPIFPFHTWSPDAYAEAPVGGSVILAAVMAKLGTYGIIRFDLSLFPRAVVDLAPLLLTLGVVGILYGAIVACATKDLKRLVAYSSLAHLGFIVLGTFALTTQALTGSVIQMVNHGLIIALLFIVISWIYKRRKTWQTSELRGLQRPAPMLAAVFMLALLATIGLPGLNDFVGEFLILLGTFVTHRWWAVVATGGVVVAAIYMLWAYQQTFHHEPDPANADTPDITWREGAVVAPLVILIIFLGVYPKPVLDRITPSVNLLLRHVDQATGKAVVSSGRPFSVPLSSPVTSSTGTTRAHEAGTVAARHAPRTARSTAAVGVAHVISAPTPTLTQAAAATLTAARAGAGAGSVMAEFLGRLS
jgi:NADH-quinone oxidoreductase subunit M